MLALARKGDFLIEIPINAPYKSGMAKIKISPGSLGDVAPLLQESLSRIAPGAIVNYSLGECDNAVIAPDNAGISALVILETTKSIIISGALKGDGGVLHVELMCAEHANAGVSVLVLDAARMRQINGDCYGNVIAKASSGTSFQKKYRD